MSYYMGIDPGKKGSIAVIDDHRNIVELRPLPLLKLKKKDYHIPMVIATLGNIKRQYKDLYCVLEKAQAMPGQGVVSMFSIGKGYGMLLTALTALYIPFQEVHPRVWCNELLRGAGGKGKERNYSCATKLFPHWKPKFKYEQEYADSLLLAEYAKRIC